MEKPALTRSLIRGFQYKDKEGYEMLNLKSYVNGRYTLLGGMLDVNERYIIFVSLSIRKIEEWDSY